MWLGIDLGTTTLRAGIAREGNLRLIADPYDQSFTIPAAICLTAENHWLIGRAAENMRVQFPDRFQSEFKRDLGAVEPYLFGTRLVTAEELFTEVLRWIRSEAIRTLNNGNRIDGAVISVPSHFEGYRRTFIQRAALAAGFTQVELIDEPVAVLLGHSHTEHTRSLVLDFGGGSFTATSLQHVGQNWQPVARPVVLNSAGGDSYDRSIFQHLIAHLPQVNQLITNREGSATARIRDEVWQLCRKLKHQLTITSEASVWVTQSNPPCEYRLGRDELRRMLLPQVNRAFSACRLLWEEIVRSGEDAPLLIAVGGGSRMPLITDSIRDEFKLPSLIHSDPDLAIVRGAAIRAQEREKASRPNLLPTASRRPAPRPGKGVSWDF